MKRTTFVTTLAATALLAACGGDKPAASSSGDGAKATLKFSAIPDQNSTELKEKFDALAAHLSEKLSIPVEYVPSSDYGASVELFKNGDIQLAWFGGLTGVQARAAVEGANAIVQGKADPEYFSYFIANADTGLEMSEEFPAAIKDMKFTFGSNKSTSGRLMPSYFIEQATGKKPEDFFTQPVGFSGSHDKTCELVESGQWQVGALSYKTYDKLTAAGKIDPEKAKVIWKTPVYADYNFTAHPALEATYGEGFTQKLADTLIAIKDPALLSAFPREALIPAKNSDFDGIVEVAKKLDFLR
ncbi:putative selenate ABC transporter substrate-binding protein [Verrucomicrobiales bacterium]|nr:putative selenate ABC transporter substrate-binding protein [Verrucomicrobiales bacterium]